MTAVRIPEMRGGGVLDGSLAPQVGPGETARWATDLTVMYVSGLTGKRQYRASYKFHQL